VTLEDGETVVLEKPANIRRHLDYVVGKVRVTNRRLQFELSRLNARVASIPLKDIARVETFSRFGLIPTGVRVTLRDGSEWRFGVLGRKQVIDAIGRVAA